LIQVVGIEKVGKSGLCFDIVRWFRKYHGYGVLLEHESKFNPDWAASIIGWDEPDALTHIPCESIDAWQTYMGTVVEEIQHEMLGTKTDPRPGKTWPFAMIVDSLMGKATMESQNRISTAGFAGKAWADEARMITQYMRFIPQRIARWPFLMIGVNHLKPSVDPNTQAKVRNVAGGRGVNFQESIELEVNWSRQGRKKSRIRHVDKTGMMLRINCENNSYGDAHNEIGVTVWKWLEEIPDPDTGDLVWKPQVVWDWHGSTVALILRDSAATESARGKQLKQLVNIRKVSNASLAYCRQLGIPKSDPQPFDVVGQMVYENEELMAELRRLYGITVWPAFQPGVDFDEQLASQKRKLAKEKVRIKKRRPSPSVRPVEKPSDETGKPPPRKKVPGKRKVAPRKRRRPPSDA
jgi:hypothetical protein